MVLIRCMSAGENSGNFNNDFQETIVVEPNSKICLVNASLSLNAESIAVTNSNNSLQFKLIDSGQYYQVSIPVDNYTQTKLVDTLTAVMNGAITNDFSDPQFMGFRWLVGITSGKLNINFGREGVELLDNTKGKNVDMNPGGTAIVATESGDGTVMKPNFKSFAWSTSVVTPGGYIASNIRKGGGGGENDECSYVFGLLKEMPGTTATTLNKDQYLIGVRQTSSVVGGVNGNSLYFVLNGVEETLLNNNMTQTLGENYEIFIGFEGGKAKVFTVEDDDLSTLTTRKTVDFPYDANGHHVGCSLLGSSTIAEVNYFPDPFTSSNVLNSDSVAKDLPVKTLLHQAIGLTNVSKTKVTLDFVTESTKSLLGFDYLSNDVSAIQGSFGATYSLPSSNVPSNIMVEVPTFFTMRSYDAKTSKRRPILSVIPSLIQNANRLVYDSQYPVWIPLDNAYPLPLTQLNVRLLDSDTDEEIRLEDPGVTLTILISKD